MVKNDDQTKTMVLKEMATDIQKKKSSQKGAKAIEEERELIAKQIKEIKASDDTVDNKIDAIANLDYRAFGEKIIIDAILDLYNEEYASSVTPNNISWYVNRIGIGNDFIEYAKSEDQKDFFRKEKQEYIKGLKKQLEKYKDTKKEESEPVIKEEVKEEPVIKEEKEEAPQDDQPKDIHQALEDFIQEMETNIGEEDIIPEDEIPTGDSENGIAATINTLRDKAEALQEKANKTRDAIARLEQAEEELNRINEEENAKIEEIKKEYAQKREDIMLEIKNIEQDSLE